MLTLIGFNELGWISEATQNIITNMGLELPSSPTPHMDGDETLHWSLGVAERAILMSSILTALSLDAFEYVRRQDTLVAWHTKLEEFGVAHLLNKELMVFSAYVEDDEFSVCGLNAWTGANQLDVYSGDTFGALELGIDGASFSLSSQRPFSFEAFDDAQGLRVGSGTEQLDVELALSPEHEVFVFVWFEA
jgi:hypothetical protein